MHHVHARDLFSITGVLSLLVYTNNLWVRVVAAMLLAVLLVQTIRRTTCCAVDAILDAVERHARGRIHRA